MFKKIESYFLSSYELADSRSYYLRLSIAIGIAFTVFVFLFDPYENYSYPLKYAIPIRLIQIGYGLNVTFVIYLLFWILFQKIGYSKVNHFWKTYHQWLLLIGIYLVAGFSGTVYHRLFIDVGEVDLNYYVFVTIPRSILIGGVLFVISILYEKLKVQNKRIELLQKFTASNIKATVLEKVTPKGSIVLNSPIIKQNVAINPQNIIFLKAYGNYVEIHLKNEERAKLLRSPLHFVAEQLSPYHYIRKCHRQYYINIHEVDFYKGNSERIILRIKESMNTIPVSKKYTKEILSII